MIAEPDDSVISDESVGIRGSSKLLESVAEGAAISELSLAADSVFWEEWLAWR